MPGNVKVGHFLLKIAVIFMALGAFYGCVSMKEYRAQEAVLQTIKDERKQIRREIVLLEQENKRMRDSLALLRKSINDSKESEQVEVKKEGLFIRTPSYNEAYLCKGCKDTQTAKNATWMSYNERQVIYYLNIARMDPKGFVKKYLKPKMKGSAATDPYYTTLVTYMEAMPALKPLYPNKEAYESAFCHAKSSGERNYVGHDRKGSNCTSTFFGECCSYGVEDPLGVVIQLLVDTGVPSLGHRYICLGSYTSIGVSQQPHKGWEYNTVLDFL